MSLVAFGLMIISSGIIIDNAFGARITSYICFDVNPQLPPCNFEWIKKNVGENIPLSNTRDDNDNIISQNRHEIIIYKLMDCIPSGLLYSLPKCKTEDYFDAQKIVEIPLISSDIDTSQWWNFIKSNRDKSSINEQIKNFHSHEINDDSLVKLIKKKTKIVYPMIKDSYNIKYHQHWSGSDTESSNKNRRKSRSDPTNLGIEFPYSEAIPFDPKKHWMLLHHQPEEMKYERDVSIVPKEVDSKHKTDDTSTVFRRRRLIEFPYAKAIPFDPKKHSMLLNKLEDHREIPLVSLNSLRLKDIQKFDVSNSMNMAMLNHLNEIGENQVNGCEISTRRTREIIDDERKIVLENWKISEFRRRLIGQLRHKMPTRTMKKHDDNVKN